MPSRRRALISVSDKTGVKDLARALAQQDFEILSTGGTAALLRDQGIAVTEVSDYTGFPEIMDGRVKTLHPRIHGGLLGRTGVDEQAMAAHAIEPIEVLVVNLYPFEKTVADPACDLATAIENIDVGGPAMIRAAAKNHARVAVVVDPADYQALAQELKESGAISEGSRYALALKAFEHTAGYDAAIANYLSARRAGGGRTRFPRTLTLQFHKQQDLRYGENPHQRAAFYADIHPPAGSLALAPQLQGKELSFNNLADADTALECVLGFEDPACVIVKHANPCGVALGRDLLSAYERAHAADPQSAFGGIIAVNRPLDAATARAAITERFVEVIVAPEVEAEAVQVLADKPGIRVLAVGQRGNANDHEEMDYRRVYGGLLMQRRDQGEVHLEDLKIVTERFPEDREIRDLFFAWRVVKYVKSNAIVYARDAQTIGIGAGQMSRVYSARIGVMRAADAGFDFPGCVMASDAFFPFRDTVDQAAQAGVAAIIQPGGSVRDDEIIAAANEHGIAMVFTGMRHFRH